MEEITQLGETVHVYNKDRLYFPVKGTTAHYVEIREKRNLSMHQ